MPKFVIFGIFHRSQHKPVELQYKDGEIRNHWPSTAMYRLVDISSVPVSAADPNDKPKGPMVLGHWSQIETNVRFHPEVLFSTILRYLSDDPIPYPRFGDLEYLP